MSVLDDKDKQSRNTTGTAQWRGPARPLSMAKMSTLRYRYNYAAQKTRIDIGGIEISSPLVFVELL